jgi:hypothetical protein
VKNELFSRLLDLQEQLYDCSDTRNEEAVNYRKELMTSKWLQDKLKLLSRHYINISNQEISKISIESTIIRKHYAFQSNISLSASPHLQGPAELSATAEPEFEIVIETDELAGDEKEGMPFNRKFFVDFIFSIFWY